MFLRIIYCCIILWRLVPIFLGDLHFASEVLVTACGVLTASKIEIMRTSVLMSQFFTARCSYCTHILWDGFRG